MASQSSIPSPSVMLAINEKKTNSLNLYRPLRNYIVINYSERVAQSLEDDLETFKQLRSDIQRGGTADSLSARHDLLQNYYKALCAMESRFRISPDKEHVMHSQDTGMKLQIGWGKKARRSKKMEVKAAN